MRGVDDVHADRAFVEFERDGGAVVGGVELEPTAVHQRKARGDGGMTGQRDFLAGREIPCPEIRARAGARTQHETRFGEVLFAGDGLHRGGVEIVGVEHDGAGVPGERPVGESVHLHEGVGLGHAANVLRAGRRGKARQNVGSGVGAW